MSKPKGNRTQREMIEAAQGVLHPRGFTTSIDLAEGNGHKKMNVMLNGKRVGFLMILSTPRDDGNAVRGIEQRARKLLQRITGVR